MCNVEAPTGGGLARENGRAAIDLQRHTGQSDDLLALKLLHKIRIDFRLRADVFHERIVQPRLIAAQID